MLDDVLSGLTYALDTPGALTRGLLSGKAGERVNPRELLQGWGAIGDEPDDSWAGWGRDLAVGAATDPLTYLGLAGGGVPGANAAFARLGPRLGGSAAKLAELAIPAEHAASGGASLAGEVLGSPAARAVLNEIPQGSKFLGAGAESLNLSTPQGDVLKLLRHNPKSAVGVPDVEGLINPTRRVVHGGFEVNRVPLATSVGDPAVYDAARAGVPRMNAAGVDGFDLKPEDVGLIGGRPTILDMGSVDSATPFSQILGRTPGRFRGYGMGLGGSLGAALGQSGGY